MERNYFFKTRLYDRARVSLKAPQMDKKRVVDHLFLNNMLLKNSESYRAALKSQISSRRQSRTGKESVGMVHTFRPSMEVEKAREEQRTSSLR